MLDFDGCGLRFEWVPFFWQLLKFLCFSVCVFFSGFGLVVGTMERKARQKESKKVRTTERKKERYERTKDRERERESERERYEEEAEAE